MEYKEITMATDNTFRSKLDNALENIKALLKSGHHLSVGYSAGKDSSCVLILLLEAIRQLLEERVHVPHCYVMNSNTRMEMPQMDYYVMGQLMQLRNYIAKHNLPVSVEEVEPSLSGRFTWTVIGRGKLPRYVGQSRDCFRDMKIVPQQRLIRQLKAESNGDYISMEGVRFDESAVRADTMKRFLMDGVNISVVDGTNTYAPIAEWDLDDVWELIAGCATHEETDTPRLFRTFTANFSEMMTLYRDANSGICGVIIGDGGQNPLPLENFHDRKP
jgi:3'-phosphoadenosine 5'-phosphosulfate sulfotransferase (PAPS reductase)/FAD synthetase